MNQPLSKEAQLTAFRQKLARTDTAIIRTKIGELFGLFAESQELSPVSDEAIAWQLMIARMPRPALKSYFLKWYDQLLDNPHFHIDWNF